jgi:hypothetical protein
MTPTAQAALGRTAHSPASLGKVPSTSTAAAPDGLTPNPTCYQNDLAEKTCVYAESNGSLVFAFSNFLGPGEYPNGVVIKVTGVHTRTQISKVYWNTTSYAYSISVPNDEYLGFVEPNDSAANVWGFNFDLVVAKGDGYWLASANGYVLARGGASYYGSLATIPTTDPVVGIASTPDGKGYWEVTRSGGVAH